MPTLQDYRGLSPAWCPGCGNYSILKSFKDAMIDMNIEPHQFAIVSGIGQAAKFPHYVKCNVFNGLHGRALPVAAGMRLANHHSLSWCLPATETAMEKGATTCCII